MSTESEQYRAGFETWARDNGHPVRFNADGSYAGMNSYRFEGYAGGRRESGAAPSAKPVAYAVVSVKGGVHKLAITRESAERKATKWQEEWPNNGCRVRPLAFADELAAGALTEDAKGAALIEVGNRLAGALEVLSTATRNNGSSEFVTALIAEWRAHTKAGSGK
jgi:hypothetical protein